MQSAKDGLQWLIEPGAYIQRQIPRIISRGWEDWPLFIALRIIWLALKSEIQNGQRIIPGLIVRDGCKRGENAGTVGVMEYY